MVWPFKNRALTATDLVLERTAARNGISTSVTRERALAHSAVWACLRLRADLVSTLPVDVFRDVAGIAVETPKPPVMISPGGETCRWMEWTYSTEFDLDSVGNTFGIIKARDAGGRPALIELVPYTDVIVQVRKGVLNYRIAGKEYDADQIWHEKQFTTSGMPVGLSPVAYAAMSINGYLSAQQFAQQWFTGGAMPASHLKNTAKVLNKTQAQETKEAFQASVTNGGVFVTGSDWDYEMLSAKGHEAAFLDEMNYGLADVCRFFGVPADMIDVAPGNASSVTYANVTQRNLQLLIMNLNPALRRREEAISHFWLPAPRYMKFNRGGILEMDLKSRYDSYAVALENKFMVQSEVRALENLQPYTPDQLAEIALLSPAKAATPAPSGVSS